jgi:hypothetical protein
MKAIIILLWTAFVAIFFLGLIFEFGRAIARVFIKMAVGFWYERKTK